MNQSKMFIPTQKYNPKGAQAISHIMMIRAGYIHQNAAGIYTYLPLATKVLQKIETIIRQEIDKIGANEVRMPFLQPSDIWEKSGRWNDYGAELFRVSDCHKREFALAPTHEEVATDMVIGYLNSYKKYPLNIYQIQTKMRDEKRPRFGLLRGREFTMFDGYSFHESNDSLMNTYREYYQAYTDILKRLKLEYKIVKADNGSMGGNISHEFIVLSDIGEDTICFEDNTEFAYNIEVAPVLNKYTMQVQSGEMISTVYTPNMKNIKQLETQMNFNINKMIKCVAYNIDGKLVMAFIKADRDMQETKLLRFIKGKEIKLASEQLILDNNLIPGFLGPIGVGDQIQLVFDQEIEYMADFICGANTLDNHLINVNNQDLLNPIYADIRQVEAGDCISESGLPVKLRKGIEIGHTFALGDKYTNSLGLKFINKEQENKVALMGSYGIGVSRILSAYIEQKHQDGKIVFGKEISPFDYHLIPLDFESEGQKSFTLKIEKQLLENGFTVLVDDRDRRVGEKLSEAELIGCNNQIIIGRDFEDNIVEKMTYGQKTKININDILGRELCKK